MVSLIFTLFLAEIALRYYYFGRLSIVNSIADRFNFYTYNQELGWSPVPNSEGYYSNPRQGINAYIKYDGNGIRLNDNSFDSTGKSILVVGDSITAGFEVDNNETYSAILERLFFENGCNYRVYNAGVMGYGTDQSLWIMEKLLDNVKPSAIIYMFTSNDFRENRTIKSPNFKWGKPVFALSGDDLILINMQSKIFDMSYYSYINYNDDGYEITEGYINEPLRRIMQFIKNNFAIFFPLKTIYSYLQISPDARIEKEVVYEDYKILELIIERMKKDGIELYFTSYPYEGEEVYIDDFMRISDNLGITYLNIYPYFNEEWTNYHWKKDRHWNEKGHLQAATGLYELLSPHLCEK